MIWRSISDMKTLKEVLNKIFRIKEVDYKNPINKEIDVKYIYEISEEQYLEEME